MRDRRIKIVSVSADLELGWAEFVTFLAKLPADAKFIRAYGDYDRNLTQMLFRSEQFDNVEEGHEYPILELTVTRDEVAEMSVLLNEVYRLKYKVNQPAATQPATKIRPTCNCGLEYLVGGTFIHTKQCASLRRD